MIGPYPVGDFRRIYFDYFNSLSRHIRKISLRGKQLNGLLYFVSHPASCPYDIKPSSKTSETRYRWAKLAVKHLQKSGLIAQVAIGKHASNDCSLTDQGIYYLIKNTKLPYTMLLQDMIKNYSDSNIFQYLVYPFIKFETLCSAIVDLCIIAGIGNYLVSTIQKMDNILLQLDEVRSEREIYFWDYDKLEEYLREKYHYNFINILDCEEDSDEDHIEIRYFDTENNNSDVKVIFNKKNNEGYIYTKNKKIKKYRIPLITDYLKKKIVTHYDYMVGYFDSFCSPKNEEFIPSIILKYPVDTANSGLLFVLSNDKLFTEALKEYEDHFDTVCKRITLYPDFLF